MSLIYDDKEPNDIQKFVWAVYTLQLLTLFTGGISFIVAGVIAYIKYDDSIGSIEESHFKWQIKTLWIGLVGFLLGILLLIVWIGVIVIVLVKLWIVYRVIKGAYHLQNRKEITDSR